MKISILIVASGLVMGIGGLNHILYADGPLEIISTGVGTSPESAEKNALMNAVQQVLGTYLDAKTLIENDDLLQDRLLMVSSGYVSSYEIVKYPSLNKLDDLYHITVRAFVKGKMILNQLHEANITTFTLAGQDAWANAYTSLETSKDGKELLTEALSGLSAKLLIGEFVSDSGKRGKEALQPAVKVDQDTREVWCAWNINVSYDRERYYAEYMPRLKRILESVAIRYENKEITRTSPNQYRSIRSKKVLDCGGRKVAASDDWVRWLDHSANEPNQSPVVEKLPELDTEREFLVLLNAGTDRTSQRHGFNVYVLPMAVYWDTIQGLSPTLYCRVRFLDSTNAVIYEEMVPLNSSLISQTKRFSDSLTTHQIPIKAEQIAFCNTGMILFGRMVYWTTGGGYPPSEKRKNIIISPEFASVKNTWTELHCGSMPVLSDSLTIRLETLLPVEYLKKITQAQIEFVTGDVKRNY